MKMAIRLNECAEGLDAEIMILDLRPRLKLEVIEQSAIGHRDQLLYENGLDEINALIVNPLSGNAS